MSVLIEPNTVVLSPSSSGSLQFRQWPVMRHLLWKDFSLVGSLLIAILASTLVFNLVVWLLMTGDPVSQIPTDMAVMLWIMMPNMIALGAPAMLIGSEQESGTMGWTRSLPVSWQSFALSKAVVSIAVWLVIMATSSIFLWWLLRIHTEPLSVFSADLLRPESVLRLVMFSTQLLLVGLVLSYIFQSPVASLLALVPVTLLLSVTFNWICRSDMTFSSTQYGMKLLTGVGAFSIAGLGLLQAIAARHRMGRPKRTAMKTTEIMTQLQPYVSSRELWGFKRPSVLRALLWQAFRQQAWPLLGLSLIVCMCLLTLNTEYHYWRSPPMSSWVLSSLVVLVLLANWLGCLCFFGDSVSRRHLFAADRGVSSRSMWWTRMAAPTLVMLVTLWCLSSIFAMATYRDYALAMATPIVAFGAGQLASMWIRRSTLAFFIGPVIFAAVWMAVWPLASFYRNYYGAFALVSIPLFYATWGHCQRWMFSQFSQPLRNGFISLLLLAPMLSYISIFVQRYALTPAPILQWRKQMLAMPLPDAFRHQKPVKYASAADYLRPWLEIHGWESLRNESAFESCQWNGDQPPTDNELLTFWNRVNRYNQFWPPDLTEAENLRVCELKLQWAKTARQAVLEGKVHPASIFSFARRDEYSATFRLRTLPRDKSREVISQMASPELIRESWRMALIMEWRLYQQQPPSTWKSFGGTMVDDVALRHPIELTRMDRYIDAATQETLALLASDVSDPRYADHDQAMHRMWDEVYDETFGPQPLPFDDTAESWRKEIISP